MNKCATCKFWLGNGECVQAREIGVWASTPRDRLAYFADAADDSGLTYGVRTGPEFGCIHHKGKETQE